MPGSIRKIDTTTLPHDSTEDSSLSSLAKMKNDRRKSELLGQIQLPPSPADSEAQLRDPDPPSPKTECRHIREVDRGAPGDASIFSSTKTLEQKDLARRKSSFYGDIFASREPPNTARERVTKNSMIMIDVKTNVIIQDEFQFITDLSAQLSSRYQRSESSIVVTVSHSTCLLFGGSFDPAYTLTITALASQLQPVTNKRNAAIVAKAMEDGLGVGAERGVIKFQAIAEENVATNGKTVAGEIEDMRKDSVDLNSSWMKGDERRGSQSKSRRQSMRSGRNSARNSQLPTQFESIVTESNLAMESRAPAVPPLPTDYNPYDPSDQNAEKTPKVGKRRSLMALFGKS